MESKFYTRLIMLLAFTALHYTKTDAQQVFGAVNKGGLSGDFVDYNLPSSVGGDEFIIGRHCLDKESCGFIGTFNGMTATQVYCTAPGEEIIGQTICIINNHVVVTLLVSSGPGNFKTVVYNDFYGTITENPDFMSGADEITGDALYVRSANYVTKSTDHGLTWASDTAGLNSTYLHSICTDTFQKVYLAANIGLLTQTANGSTWVLNSNYPATYCALVYCDRRNRLFAESSTMLYISNDTGAHFLPDTAGLGGLGLRRVSSLSDDIFGNIYAIIDNKEIYRSTGGTQPFVRIDQPLSALNNDSLHSSPFNHVSGDSVLFAATAFGSFYSLDQGNTWTADNEGISAQSLYSLVRAGNGKMLTTTNLGCFSSTNAGDTTWLKVYPDTGYVGGRPLYKDNSGALYTQGGTLFKDFNFQTRMVVKSTDNGATWQPDTLGISQMIMATWFVDETGTQHAAQWGTNTAPTQLFSKAPNQPWAADNGGFTGDSAIPVAFGSNGNGKIYYSDNSRNILYSKQGAGNWTADSAGLSNAYGIYDFAHNSSGNMYLGGYIGIWKQTGNSWVQINYPPSLTSYTYSAFAVAVDAGNTVWAAFSHFDIYYNSIGDGVYYTNDDGVTWHRPSFDIDTVTFLKLVAMGDSVYGLSYYNGAYLFDKNGITSVNATGENNRGFVLFPNPAKSSCTLQLTGNPEICSAAILDITGREVLLLFSNQRVSDFNFSTDKLCSGLYFVHVNNGTGNRAVCKLIKE